MYIIQGDREIVAADAVVSTLKHCSAREASARAAPELAASQRSEAAVLERIQSSITNSPWNNGRIKVTYRGEAGSPIELGEAGSAMWVPSLAPL